MITITAETLKDRKCRERSIETFNRLFPKGLTLKSEQEAVDAAVKVSSEFDWYLASLRYLNAAGLGEYHKAQAPAFAEYKKAKAPAFAEYKKVEGMAWAEYEKVEGMAWAEYEKVAATAFARLFWKQEVGE